MSLTRGFWRGAWRRFGWRFGRDGGADFDSAAGAGGANSNLAGAGGANSNLAGAGGTNSNLAGAGGAKFGGAKFNGAKFCEIQSADLGAKRGIVGAIRGAIRGKIFAALSRAVCGVVFCAWGAGLGGGFGTGAALTGLVGSGAGAVVFASAGAVVFAGAANAATIYERGINPHAAQNSNQNQNAAQNANGANSATPNIAPNGNGASGVQSLFTRGQNARHATPNSNFATPANQNANAAGANSNLTDPAADPHADAENFAPEFDENGAPIANNRADEIALPRHMSVEVASAPASVVVGQPFNVTLRTKTHQKIGFEMELRLGEPRNNSGKTAATLLNEPVFDEVAGGEFMTTLWFAMPSMNATLTDASVILRRNGEFFQSRKVALHSPRVRTFDDVADFSGLVAQEFALKNFKVARFDAAQNIVTMELAATNSNLRDFALRDASKQGFSGVRGDFFRQNMQFWALVPDSQSELVFSYFDTRKGELVRVRRAINIEELGDNANTDLNPQQSSWTLQKRIALGAVGGAFFVLGAWRALGRRKAARGKNERSKGKSGADANSNNVSQNSNLADLAGGSGGAGGAKSSGDGANSSGAGGAKSSGDGANSSGAGAGANSGGKNAKTAAHSPAKPPRRGLKSALPFWFITLLCAGGFALTLEFNTRATLAAKSVVRILPVPTSTIFFVAPEPVEVEVMKRHNDFAKIKLQNKIGWTPSENLRAK